MHTHTLGKHTSESTNDERNCACAFTGFVLVELMKACGLAAAAADWLKVGRPAVGFSLAWLGPHYGSRTATAIHFAHLAHGTGGTAATPPPPPPPRRRHSNRPSPVPVDSWAAQGLRIFWQVIRLSSVISPVLLCCLNSALGRSLHDFARASLYEEDPTQLDKEGT